MSAADYLEGVAVFVPMLAGALGGAWLLLRKRFGWLRGAEVVTAYGVLATLALLVIHLVPAMLGVLGRGSVLAAAALWLAGCAMVPPAPRPPGEAPRPEVEDEYARFSWPLAVGAAALVALFVLAFARDQITVPAASVDFASFHMPDVARWIQEGTIWNVASFLPSVAPGNYPNNGDVMLLAFVLPWHNDFLSHFGSWPFYPLTGLASYAVARRLGAARPAATVGGALLLAIPAVGVSTLPIGLVDAVMYFGFAAGLLFLLRHHETGSNADLLLAGLSLGISFGTKWYGVSAVAIVVAVWAVARLLGGAGWRRVLSQTGLVTAAVAAAGGVWLLRNWITSGNPVFPVRVAPFGVTVFDAPPDLVRELAGFTILDYIYDADVWSSLIWPQYELALAAPAALALVGGLVAAVLLTVRRNRTDASRGLLTSGVVCTVLLLVAYAITPYTAGGPEGEPRLVAADSRYVVPALIVALALTAWVAGRARWGGLALSLLGAAAVVHGISWSARGSLSTASLTAVDWAAGVAIALGIGALIALAAWWMRRSETRRGRTLGLAALVGVLGLAAVVAGHPIQKRFNDDRYLGAEPVLDALAERAPPGSRVGLTGAWADFGLSPILPAFGPRFENEVEYVGPLVREMRQRYEARDPFVEALGRGEYDFLVVGRGRPEGLPAEEGDWAASVGWQLVARSDRLELYLPPA